MLKVIGVLAIGVGVFVAGVWCGSKYTIGSIVTQLSGGGALPTETEDDTPFGSEEVEGGGCPLCQH